MKIAKLDLTTNPESITSLPYDCLWVALAARKNPTPLQPLALQWIDWKLCGAISRYLVERRYETPVVTFLPTMKRLAASYVVLDSQPGQDWEGFLKTSEGLQLKEVLYLCEDESQIAKFSKSLSHQRASVFPVQVTLGQSS